MIGSNIRILYFLNDLERIDGLTTAQDLVKF